MNLFVFNFQSKTSSNLLLLLQSFQLFFLFLIFTSFFFSFPEVTFSSLSPTTSPFHSFILSPISFFHSFTNFLLPPFHHPFFHHSTSSSTSLLYPSSITPPPFHALEVHLERHDCPQWDLNSSWNVATLVVVGTINNSTPI